MMHDGFFSPVAPLKESPPTSTWRRYLRVSQGRLHCIHFSDRDASKSTAAVFEIALADLSIPASGGVLKEIFDYLLTLAHRSLSQFELNFFTVVLSS